LRDQIRNEVREEVLARARSERWGVPGALPEWLDRITVDADMRVRAQHDNYQTGNPTPQELLEASLSGTTRVPDLAAGTAQGLATANTTVDRNRARLRARLGFTTRIDERFSAGLRLATGSSTDRVSTNQTLGQNFNRYTFLVDQAYIRYEPWPGISTSAGRIPNPWFSTDLVWNDSLNFEGIAGTVRPVTNPNAPWQPFFTAGYFPVREGAPPRRGRGLLGAQMGLQWELSPTTRFRVGLAQYQFRYFEGQIDGDFDPVSGPGPSYGQYEYEAGLRQRGNTLFLTNNPAEIQAGLTPDRARWGLASKFRPWALTVAGEFRHFMPVFVGVSGELVRNEAYDRGEIAGRTGVFLDDARVFGAGARLTVGAQRVRELHEWQFTLGYKWLGSDAVPDAFVDSDVALGGTNVKGLSVGFTYGLGRESSVGLRVISGSTISSPTVRNGFGDKFGVDTIQVDVNARF
jgi:Putative porin